MAAPIIETSGTIQVEMEVSRYRELKDDKLVEVWGWVGDYEVAVCFPANDPRVRALPGEPQTGTR